VDVAGPAVAGGTGMNAGMGVKVGVGEGEESVSRPGSQADTIKLITRASTTVIRRLVFIGLLIHPTKYLDTACAESIYVFLQTAL